MKNEIIRDIREIFKHNGLEDLYISEIGLGSSPILRSGDFDEDTFTLDRIICSHGNLTFEGSSSWDNMTIGAEDLNVEILDDILNFLLDNEEEIKEYVYIHTPDNFDADEAWLEMESNQCEQDYFNS